MTRFETQRNYQNQSVHIKWSLAAVCLSAIAMLSACGGGSNPADQVASGTVTMQMDVPTLPSAVAEQVATPFSQSVPSPDSEPVFTPMATGTTTATYTPAQIRAAYSLPDLPASGTPVTAAKAAQMGAGQTIYIVNAYHNPNAIAELAAFNQKFALPTCATKVIAPTAALPLATASTTACEFSVVYNTAAGGMTATAPAYNSGWATEIALDVQWAHATAPLARIVLIEAPDASLNSLLGAIKLANSMGPGIVSMSFGAAEGNWTASVDSVFTAPKMTYLAATGDSGMAVSWPSVSPNVLAVGGTTLSYSGTGPRSEVSWSGTGGGISAYSATPGYQSNAVPGMGFTSRRVVADVAFNADPATGQYTAVMTPGSSTVNWLSVGGTSLSTPQWAGLIAIANASRAQASKAVLGLPHTALYSQLATVPGTYASTFADITRGSHGTCSTCASKVGYDQLTGLGTPNATSLVNSLTGTNASAAPVVPSAAVSGTVGTALSFTVSVNASNPVSWTLSGGPAGMTISNTGVVTWPTPLVGTYSPVITAKDTATGLTGQGTYSVTIASAKAPTLTATSVIGRPGVALSFAATAVSSNPVTYTISGNPAGMAINTAGVVTWASPALGTYSVTVSAKDTKTGLTGTAVYSVKIANAGPVITAAAINGTVGKALSSSINISDASATSFRISISGVPLGMTFSLSGMNVIATWAKPVAGTYSLKVVVTNNNGLSSQATVPVTIK